MLPAARHEVNLSAARNEYQSFQIVVNGAADGLSNVNVKVSDLEAPGGGGDPANQLHAVPGKVCLCKFVKSQLGRAKQAAGSPAGIRMR